MTNVYSVVSRFHFDVESAVADSKLLQDNLQKVASAADQVHEGLKSAALGLVQQIGIYGGIGGALYTALKAADKFEATQRSIAAIFLSNNMFQGAQSFEHSMVASAEAMENMKNAARQFSLPIGDFVSTAKLLGAALVNKGLDDSSMKKSVMLTRGYLKSAGILGVDPGLAQNELLDLLSGHGSMNSRLAQRLVNETAAFRPYASGQAHQSGGQLNKFNMAKPEERLKVLTEALMQFGSNAKVVEENAKSLSSQMQRLSDNFLGMFSILRPIGDALLQPVKKILLGINLWLESEGENVSKKIAGFLREIFDEPIQFFAKVQQLRHIRSDMHHTGEIIEYVATIQFLTFALRKLGFTLQGGLMNTLFQKLLQFGSWVINSRAFAMVMHYLGVAVEYLVKEVLPPLVLGLTILQGLSRGWALAEVKNMQWVKENAAAITQLFLDLKKAFDLIMAPIELAIEGIAELTSHLLSHNIAWDITLGLLGRFAEVLQGIGNIIVAVMAAFSAVFRALMAIMDLAVTIGQFDFKGVKEKFLNLPDQIADGYNLIWDKFHKKMGDVDNNAVATSVVNIGNVTIQNQFKEQMEPDRIAFALKEQLLKTANNPTQARGVSMNARSAGLAW